MARKKKTEQVLTDQTPAPRKRALPRKGKIKQRIIVLATILVVLVAGGISIVHALTQSKAIAADLAQIRNEHRVVDVHEHIQSIKQAPTMIAAMDAAGIGKMVLMGSSWFTVTLNPSVGFTRYDEINEDLLRICKEYPGRFEAWPTISPKDPQKLEKFKSLVERGAAGLKLYLGHGYVVKKTNQYMFHTMAIDDPEMLPIYKYCQENFIPVCLHVNPSPKTPGFAEEFVTVLNEFPDMKVVCPHWMLSSIKESRLEQLLDTFPNLYTDVSFGHDDFLVPGLHRISKSPLKYKKVFAKYPTRFMFSCDLVVTDEPIKDVKWISDRFNAYIDMLTKDTYTTPVIPNQTLHGLALSPYLLDRVLYKNYEDFMALRPKDTKIKRKIDWSKMGVTPVERRPGQAFPPPIL